MSEQLYKFLREWYDWSLDGGKEHPIFCKDSGLCNLAFEYGRQVIQAPPNGGVRLLDELIDEMDADGLDTFCPFSTLAEYERECLTNTIHINPRRLGWVYYKLVEYEDL